MFEKYKVLKDTPLSKPFWIDFFQFLFSEVKKFWIISFNARPTV
jgi:hypothetical protein